jgi:hypothetical protein
MTLAPSASFTLGDLRYASHAAELSVTLATLPGVSSFRVDLPAAAEVTCQPGDPARLDLDGGEGSQTVLVGSVRAVTRRFGTTHVVCADAGADLAALRSASTFVGQAGSDVIARLADEAGVTVGDNDLDLPLAAYAADQRRTVAEHLAYLAGLGGALALVDADNQLVVRLRPDGPADTALLYGRELLELDVRDVALPAPLVPIGDGPAGSSDAPDALRPTLTPLPDGAPAPGASARWQASAVLRTPGVAVAAGEAYAKAQSGAARRLRARGFLLPALRPGMVIEIQSLPDAFGAATFLLTRVTHRIRPRDAGSTILEGEALGAAAGGLPGLLASAVSAVGSLL